MFTSSLSGPVPRNCAFKSHVGVMGKGDVQEAPGAFKVLHGGNKSSRSFTGPPKDYTNVI